MWSFYAKFFKITRIFLELDSLTVLCKAQHVIDRNGEGNEKTDFFSIWFSFSVQWNLDLRKPDLRKNLDFRKIVATADFLVHKLFDLRKIF